MKQDIASPAASDLYRAPFEIVSPRSFVNLFWRAKFLRESGFLVHLPFAFWLTEAVRPRVLVNLGIGNGVSYFGFCQAVEKLNLETLCYGIVPGEGKGDQFRNLSEYNAENYEDFSRLVRGNITDAGDRFGPGTIDLLCIDLDMGDDVLAALKETWLNRVSQRGVVVVHGSGTRFQTGKPQAFLRDMSDSYPSFTFDHGDGLTIFILGSDVNERLGKLAALKIGDIGYSEVHHVFRRLGNSHQWEWQSRAAAKQVAQAETRVAEAEDQINAALLAGKSDADKLAKLLHSYEERNGQIAELQSQLFDLRNLDAAREQEMATLREASEAAATALELAEAAAADERTLLETQIQNLLSAQVPTEELDRLRTEADAAQAALSDEIAAWQAKASTLEADLQSLALERDSAQAAEAALDDRFKAYLAEREAVDQQHLETAALLEEWRKKAKSRGGELETLREQAEAFAGEKAQLEETLAKLDDEATRSRGQSEALEAELSREITSLQQAIQAANEALILSQSDSKTLQDELQLEIARLAAIAETADTTMAALTESVGRETALSAQLVSLQSAVEAGDIELARVKAESEAEAQDLRASVARLEDSLKELLVQSDAATQALSEELTGVRDALTLAEYNQVVLREGAEANEAGFQTEIIRLSALVAELEKDLLAQRAESALLSESLDDALRRNAETLEQLSAEAQARQHAFDENLTNLRNTVGVLETTVAEQHAGLTAAEHREQILVSERDQLLESVGSLEPILEATRSERDSLEASLNALREDNDRFAADLQLQAGVVEQLEASLADMSVVLAEGALATDLAISRAESAESEVARLSEVAATLNLTLAEREAEHEQALTAARDENARLGTNVESLALQVAQFENNAAEWDTERAQYENMLAELGAEKSQLAVDIEVRFGEIARLTLALEAASSRNAELGESLHAVQVQLESQQTEFEMLQAHVAEGAALQKERERQDKIDARVRLRTERQMERLKTDLAALQESLSSEQETVAHLTEAMSDAITLRDSFDERHVALTQANNDLMTKNAELVANVEARFHEIARLTQQLEARGAESLPAELEPTSIADTVVADEAGQANPEPVSGDLLGGLSLVDDAGTGLEQILFLVHGRLSRVQLVQLRRFVMTLAEMGYRPGIYFDDDAWAQGQLPVKFLAKSSLISFHHDIPKLGARVHIVVEADSEGINLHLLDVSRIDVAGGAITYAANGPRLPRSYFFGGLNDFDVALTAVRNDRDIVLARTPMKGLRHLAPKPFYYAEVANPTSVGRLVLLDEAWTDENLVDFMVLASDLGRPLMWTPRNRVTALARFSDSGGNDMANLHEALAQAMPVVVDNHVDTTDRFSFVSAIFRAAGSERDSAKLLDYTIRLSVGRSYQLSRANGSQHLVTQHDKVPESAI